MPGTYDDYQVAYDDSEMDYDGTNYSNDSWGWVGSKRNDVNPFYTVVDQTVQTHWDDGFIRDLTYTIPTVQANDLLLAVGDARSASSQDWNAATTTFFGSHTAATHPFTNISKLAYKFLATTDAGTTIGWGATGSHSDNIFLATLILRASYSFTPSFGNTKNTNAATETSPDILTVSGAASDPTVFDWFLWNGYAFYNDGSSAPGAAITATTLGTWITSASRGASTGFYNHQSAGGGQSYIIGGTGATLEVDSTANNTGVTYLFDTQLTRCRMSQTTSPPDDSWGEAA